MSFKWVLPAWLTDPANCPPFSASAIFHMDEQQRGLCPAGPPSNMSKMGLHRLLSLLPFSSGRRWGRQGLRGGVKAGCTLIVRGLDSVLRVFPMVQGRPLTGSNENANSVCWTPMQGPNSPTPTRAPSSIITQPAPRDRESTKPRPLTDLYRGQSTLSTLLSPQTLCVFLPVHVFVCFALIDLISAASLRLCLAGSVHLRWSLKISNTGL